MVGYLLDAETGQELALKSRMNPQTQYGADVIMRANYALENTVQPLKDSIQNALDEMLSELAQEVGIHKNDIYQIAVVGNTCMHHLFLGISPASLVHAPYTPAIRQSLVLRASGVWTSCPSESTAAAPSGHCGYVGADTCGCILALRQDREDQISLMVDIGTNGEMVLGNKERLVCCSTGSGTGI